MKSNTKSLGKKIMSAVLAILMTVSCLSSLCTPVFAVKGGEAGTSGTKEGTGGFSVTLNWNGEVNSTNLEWNPTTDTSKILRLNVSYDNTNAETEEYQPDELTITINGIGVTGRDGKYTKASSIAADEKSSTDKNYDWSYEYDEIADVYTFYNNNHIDSKTNFSGSFEILWVLNARSTVNGHTAEFTADLHGDGYTVTSNTVKFSFTSVGDLFTLKEEAKPLASLQGLGGHNIALDDYVWVRYNVNKSQVTRSRGLKSSYHEVYIGEDILLRQAFAQGGSKVSFKSIGDGWYRVNTAENFYIVVGYPKDVYLVNEETARVTSCSKYIGTYYDESNAAVLTTAEATINLNDYGFTGSEAGFVKKTSNEKAFEYVEIFNDKVVNFYYSGVMLTTGYINEIGDDFLDVLLNNGEFRQLEPEEYEFSSVRIPSFADFESYYTGETPTEPFDFEVWGLMIGESDYVKLVDVQIGNDSYWFDLPEGVYRIKHVVTGITENLCANDDVFSFNVTLHLNDDSDKEVGQRVAENGYIRNIAYSNIHDPSVDYSPGSEENYTGTYAQRNIDRDMETYGHLWHRGLADVTYRGNLNSVSTTASIKTFVVENRDYKTTVAIASTLSTTSKNTENNFISKFSQYTILPKGLNVDPDSFNVSLSASSMLLQDGTVINKTASYIKRHVSVDIIEGYRNSGRTFVAFHYDFSDNPVNISATHTFTSSIGVLLSEESYLEFGGIYTVRGVTMVDESSSAFDGKFRTSRDDGQYFYEDASLWVDLDNDNNVTEEITYDYEAESIVIALASYQEIKETVKTVYTNNKYVDEAAIAGMGTTYTYRMKLQTGASRAKNIKFISVLENTEGAEWRGTFQSIDTSYAESKGFVPTVYYSESDTPSDDLTSSEWSTTAPENLENVKAIAVEFEGVQLDNSLLYFLVNMTAPNDESLIGKKTENEYSVSFTSVDLIIEQETDSGTLYSNIVGVMLKDALGDVVITKTDATNGHRLSGATFDVYKVGEDIQRTPIEMVPPEGLPLNPGFTYANGVYSSNTSDVTMDDLSYLACIITNEFVLTAESTLSFDYSIAGSSTIGIYMVMDASGNPVAGNQIPGATATSEGSLVYTPASIDLQPGTYALVFATANMEIVEGELNRAYIKNIHIKSKSDDSIDKDLSMHNWYSYDMDLYATFSLENGVYVSMNAEQANSGAGIQTAEFTITGSASFSFDYAVGGGSLFYEIKNIESGAIVAGGELEPSGQVIDESQLVYNRVSVDLDSGTYYCYFEYDLDSLSDSLDAAYIKDVCTESISKDLVGTVTTNATGTATLRNLEFGDYCLVETKAPNGYELNSNPVCFTVNQEGFEVNTNSIKVTVPNTRLKGTVVLVKTNSEDSTIPVQGATYSLYKSNGTLVQEGLVTNSDGQITVDELEWGSYYFLETERVQGYEINNDKVYFELNPDNVGEVVYVSTTDVQKPVSVILTKYDKPDTGSEITSTPVDGAVYALYRIGAENDILIADRLVTDRNGQIKLDNVLIGDYYFIEIGNAKGYQLNNEKVYFSVTGEDAEIGLVTTSTYDIRIKGSTTLVKTNPDGDYVKDAVFTLFDSNDQVVYDNLVTGADGQIVVRDLQWGSYYFKEKAAPTGYELSDKKIEFEINRYNCEAMQVVYAENTEKLSTVRLIKTSADDPTEFLQGAVFNLYRADGTEFATNLVTDSNGVIEVTNVPWGSYYFVETQAPSGFSLSSEKIRFSINYLSAGGTFEVYATNEHDTRQIDVTKRILASDINWANGNPTFLFTLSTTESSRYDNKYNAIISFDREYVLSHTGEDGYVEKTVSFTGLYADQYVLTEKETLRYEFVDIRDVVNGTEFYGNSSHPVYGNCVAFDLDKSEYGAATFTNAKTNWSDASHTENNTNIINVGRKLASLAVHMNGTVVSESSQDLDLTVYAVYDSGETELLERDQYTIEDITFDLTQDGFYDVHVYYTEKGKTVMGNVIAEVSTDALFTYVVQNGKAVITGYLGNSDTVVFPKTIKGYEVTAVGNGSVISGIRNVTTVVISDGVKTIGRAAFKDLSNLTNVTIGNGITSISAYAFYRCSGITNITMPVSSYPNSSTTFSGCTNINFVTLTKGMGWAKDYVPGSSLESPKYTPWGQSSQNANGITVVIEDGVQEIGDYTFSACAALTGELVIPDSVETIGQGAFASGNKLTSVTIGSGITSIGDSAFMSCKNLKTIYVAKPYGSISGAPWRGVANNSDAIFCTVIWSDSIVDADTGLVYCETGDYMAVTGFYDPNNTITSIEIPTVYQGKSVISIGEAAFRNCSKLTDELVIPDSVETIGSYAFRNCSKLTSIAVGNNVTLISSYAFYNCTGLTGELVIPDSVETIGDRAFSCSYGYSLGITSVTIGNGVTSIGDSAFGYCEKLRTIYINEPFNSVDGAPWGAQYGCAVIWNDSIVDADTGLVYHEDGDHMIVTGLYNPDNTITSVEIPSVYLGKPVVSIDNEAFYNCKSLKGALVIPDSVETIGSYAFYGCSKLTSVSIGNGVTSIGQSAFQNCSGLTGELVIPDSVEIIGNSAFSGCNKLTSVTIGNGVTSIGQSTFEGCSGLTGELVIPDSVEIIGNSAFSGCNKLTSVTIGSGVTSIDNNAFYKCSGLAGELIIPDSVETIGDYAFYQCTKLTSVSIGSGVTSIDNNAFNGCSGLTGELIIPDSVETIGSYAFRNCSKLTSITIGNGVTSIDNNTFNGCSGVTTLVIGENVGAIKANAFKGCSAITSVTMPISAYPTDYTTFDGCTNISFVTLTKGTGIGHAYTSYPYTYSWTPWGKSAQNPNGITVIIEEGVRSIGSCTFYYCYSLTSVTILNPDCLIYNDANTIYSGAKIRGYAGSTAETYAKRYNRTFEEITSTQGNTMISSSVILNTNITNKPELYDKTITTSIK